MANQVLFVFSGQGSQWKTMGRDLLDSMPEFRAAIEQIDILMIDHLGWSIVKEFEQEAEYSNAEITSIAQPMIFSLQVGLIEVFKKWGIVPDVVVGHSVGEVAAAYCAGIYSLKTSVDVICAQNRLLQRAEGKGTMLFVSKQVDEVIKEVTSLGIVAGVAAVNSPLSCVLSGKEEELQTIKKHFDAQGVFTRSLPVDIPFHSPLIVEYLDELSNSLPDILTSLPAVPIVSTLTGELYERGNYNKEYWINHIKEPVLFSNAIEKVLEKGDTTVIEIGPHAVLIGSMNEIIQQRGKNEHVLLSSLRRNQSGREELLQMIARFLLTGHKIESNRFKKNEWDDVLNYKKQIEAHHEMKLHLEQADSEEIRNHRLRSFIVATIDMITAGSVKIASNDPMGFMEMGIDSMTSVRLKSEIEKVIQRKLPSTLLFDYPNLDRLTNYLNDLLTDNKNKPLQEDKIEEFDAETNPIAIIGMGCRFPGGANSIDEYWDLMISGVNGISSIPEDRWNSEDYYSEENDPGKSYVSSGGFLKDVNIRNFDAEFFKIAPKEAKAMDPQQKLLLEVVWEALEYAGIKPQEIKGKNVGVYLGISTDDYKRSHLFANELTKIDAYGATGTTFSAAGGRISFFFGLEGPNISVDTACSSSLVAMHLASQAMRSGECDMAIVTGVNGLYAPNLFVYFSKLQAVSPDGLCRSFDDNANGYVRSEGCGAIVLRKWKDANKAGNKVLAIVKGTAVNQDGASSGFTAPNGIAQQKVVLKALDLAALTPQDVSYVEAHGTGTPLGDPIEIGALMEVYGKGRLDEPLLVGSVKSNIGHMEAAAGMGSLIKGVLALQNKTIPKNLHFSTPNGRINWEDSGVRIVDENTIWEGDKPFTIGISGFGFSGTNAHILLQEAPKQKEEVGTMQNDKHLICLSAKTKDGLKDQFRRYEHYLKTTDKTLDNIAYSLLLHRTHFPCRASFVVNSKEVLIDELKSYQFDNNENTSISQPKIAFLFTGQGAQYPEMGRSLYNVNDCFRSSMDQCDVLFKSITGESLTTLIYGKDASKERLRETRYTQPALFAFEYSLAKWWLSLGVNPSIMVGHSIGEFVAACLADVLSLEDAIKLITARGNLMYSLPLDGGMLSLFSSEDQVNKLLKESDSKLNIGTINSPINTVVSGGLFEIELFEKELISKGIKYKRLNVSHAFHSEKMDPILEEFKKVASEINYSTPKIPIISNVSGKLASGGDLITPDYWCDHLRMTVRYEQSVKELNAQGANVFIEIGPSPTLISLGKQCLEDIDAYWCPSFSEKSQDLELLFASVGTLYEQGHDLNWNAFFNFKRQIFTNLPTYPFQRQEYWMQPDVPLNQANHLRSKNIHPFIGEKLSSPVLGDTVVFSTQFSAEQPAFLKDHLVFERMISPAAAHLSMLLSYANYGAQQPAFKAKDIQFVAPLVVEKDEGLDVQLIVNESALVTAEFQLVSTPEGGNDWKKHCVGIIEWDKMNAPDVVNLEFLKSNYSEGMEATKFHTGLWNNGLLKLGSSFQRIESIWTAENKAFCKLRHLDNLEEDHYYEIHPGMMDSILQSCIFSSDKMVNRLLDGELFIPYGISEIRYYAQKKTEVYWCKTELNDESSEETLNSDVTVYNELGETILEIRGITVKKVRERSLLNALNKSSFEHLMYQTVWEDAVLEEKQNTADHSYLIFTEDDTHDSVAQLKETHAEVEILRRNVLDFSDEMAVKKVIDGVQSKSVSVIYLASNEAVIESIEQGTKNLLCLAQSLIKADKFTHKSLSVVTNKVFDSKTPRPFHSVIVGMIRSLMHEHDEVAITLIDNCNGDDNLVSTMLLNSDLRGIYRVEGSQVQEQKLEQKRKEFQQETPEYNRESVYVITGGFGALGKQCAQRMIDQGCVNVALIGRNAESAAAKQIIEELNKDGASVVGYSCDISKRDEVHELVHKLKDRFGVIRGIIHSAGALDDGSFVSMTWERFDHLFKSKVYGAWNLHEETQDLPLDFFIMFSSIAAVFGNQGQANYSAANAFLDGLVSMRRSQGLAASTINWGPWSGTGMAAKDDKRSAIQAKGFQAVDPNTYLDILGYVIANPKIEQIVPVKCHWKKYLSQLSKSAALFYSNVHQLKESASPSGQKSLLKELERSTIEVARELLMEKVMKDVRTILEYNNSEPLDPNKSLTELGTDSLMAIELRNGLGKSIERNLPISLLYNYPTINAIVDFLLSEVKDKEEELELELDETISADQKLEESLNQLNDEDLLAFINSELDS